MRDDEALDGISDPVLEPWLDSLRAERFEERDWNRLRESIVRQAEAGLARRRFRRRVVAAARPVAGIGLAASIALARWSGPALLERLRAPAPPSEAAAYNEEELLVQALGDDLSEQEFRLLVTGRANPEVLLAVAIGDR